jgi:LmbE family N-acetylglucosaminyl deacetylase
MNQYQQLVCDIARLIQKAKDYPLAAFPPLPRPAIANDAPNVLIFSPHPDDEVIIGGLALRLLREAQCRVINVAVTQGSNKARQPERFNELANCCKCIGFDLVQTSPTGLEKINPKSRAADPAGWAASVKLISGILEAHQPRAILFPHDLDWNSTHVGTHFLVADALKTMPRSFSCHTIETEFWGQMANPNLMVELTAQHLGDLMTALTFHVGEVKRNPYHLSLPAWMTDNVRRGSELVGGQGGAAPEYPFATLYRLRRWHGGGFEDLYTGGRQLKADEPAGQILDLSALRRSPQD